MGNSIAKRIATTLKPMPPIAEVVVQIRGHFYDADQLEVRANKHRLQAGLLLLQLRERIEAGEEGNVTWWEWFETQDLGRSRKDCERLMRIAGAEWPEKAMADEREKTRLAVAKHREKKAAELTVGSKPNGIGDAPLEVADSKPPNPEKERDRFLVFVSGLEVQNDFDTPKLSDGTLDLLTMEQKADAVEVMEKAIVRLQKKMDRLSPSGR